MTEPDDYDPSSLLAAVERSLPDTPVKPRDAAAVALLKHYATLLDDAGDRLSDAAEEDQAADFNRMAMTISRLGPRMEAMLDRLGMAPGARPALRGGEPHGVDAAAAALAKLRDDAAAAGVDDSPAVDPAVEAALAAE